MLCILRKTRCDTYRDRLEGSLTPVHFAPDTPDHSPPLLLFGSHWTIPPSLDCHGPRSLQNLGDSCESLDCYSSEFSTFRSPKRHHKNNLSHSIYNHVISRRRSMSILLHTQWSVPRCVFTGFIASQHTLLRCADTKICSVEAKPHTVRHLSPRLWVLKSGAIEQANTCTGSPPLSTKR